MDKTLVNTLLQAQKRHGKNWEITVTGDSMNPVLNEGDVIKIEPANEFSVGDILVFNYKEGELLVHRLLIIKDGNFFCKGDNSFRLEDIPFEQTIGKVIEVNGIPINQCPDRLIELSYAVNRTFRKTGYNIEKTKETEIYKLYEKIYLKREADNMLYKKNDEMDYIQTDGTSLAVFDPASGDTHLFDEQGVDILELLKEPCTLETLITKLCGIYDISSDIIKPDIEEFLKQAVGKKVVLIV